MIIYLFIEGDAKIVQKDLHLISKQLYIEEVSIKNN